MVVRPSDISKRVEMCQLARHKGSGLRLTPAAAVAGESDPPTVSADEATTASYVALFPTVVARSLPHVDRSGVDSKRGGSQVRSESYAISTFVKRCKRGNRAAPPCIVRTIFRFCAPRNKRMAVRHYLREHHDSIRGSDYGRRPRSAEQRTDHTGSPGARPSLAQIRRNSSHARPGTLSPRTAAGCGPGRNASLARNPACFPV